MEGENEKPLNNKGEQTAEEQTSGEETNQMEAATEENIDNSSANSDETAELSELEIMKKKNDELNDKYLRLYSEFENYRKRTSKERLDLIGTASAGVIKDLLTVVDDFERAIKANESSEDIEAVKEGFGLIHHKFINILQGKGLKEMEAVGNVFDVEHHEALTNIPAPSEDLKGKVVEVIEKGYYLNDSVIRYAKVIVGQ